MAITATTLVVHDDDEERNTYTTAFITPSADTLVVAFILAQRPNSGEPPQPTVTGCSLTWTLIGSPAYYDRAGQTSKMFAFRASGSSPTLGAVSAAFGGVIDACSIAVVEFPGTDVTNTNGVVTGNTYSAAETSADGTTIDFTLSSFANSTDNAAVVFAGFNSTNWPATSALTPPSGHTEMVESDVEWDIYGVSYMVGEDISGTYTVTGDSNQTRGIIAFEITGIASSTPEVPHNNLLHVGK